MTFLAQIAAFACETKGEKGNLIWMPYCKKTTFVPFLIFVLNLMGERCETCITSCTYIFSYKEFIYEYLTRKEEIAIIECCETNVRIRFCAIFLSCIQKCEENRLQLYKTVCDHFYSIFC